MAVLTDNTSRLRNLIDDITNLPSGGDTSVEDGLIDGTLTEYTNDRVESVTAFALRSRTALRSVDLWKVKTIAANAFNSCGSLVVFILRTESLCSALASNIFTNTPIISGTGYIYVPSALVEEYKAGTNWSFLAAQFRALEDYTVDGTITGELDESKIAEVTE